MRRSNGNESEEFCVRARPEKRSGNCILFFLLTVEECMYLNICSLQCKNQGKRKGKV